GRCSRTRSPCCGESSIVNSPPWPRDVARDGEAEPDPAGGRVARGIEAEEGAEDVLALGRRDARTVIVDEHVDALGDRQRRHPDVTAVAPRIAQEIADAAAHRIRA